MSLASKRLRLPVLSPGGATGMLSCWKTLRRVSPLRGSVFRWEPITWGWHPRLLHSTLPAFRPVPARRVEMAVEKKASLSAKKSASGLGVGPPSSSRPGSSRPGDIHFFCMDVLPPLVVVPPPRPSQREGEGTLAIVVPSTHRCIYYST
jgi:hypothetical protein